MADSALNVNITTFISENPQHVAKLQDSTVKHFERAGLRKEDADQAVSDAMMALMTKPAHEDTFNREGTITKRRLVKLSSHALRDMLDHAGRDALGRAMGAKTREEVKYEQMMASLPSAARQELEAPLRPLASRPDPDAAAAVPHILVEDDGRGSVGFDFRDSAPTALEILEAKTMFQEMVHAVENHYRDPARILFLIDNALDGVGRNELAEMDGISKNTMATKLTKLRKLLRKVPSLTASQEEKAIEIIRQVEAQAG